MSKELPYFRFTASEWLSDDISLESYETKGIFADVCAYYWFKDCSITKALLEKRFNNCQGTLKHLFELGIIKSNNGSEYIEILFLNKQFDLLSESRKRRQDAGSKGGKKKRSNAKAMLKQCGSYKDKDKENNKDKEKDNKTWKNDFEIYLLDCKAAYKEFWEDTELMKTQQRLNPGINVKLSIEKGFVNFWGTEAGWNHKKKNRSKEIDWKATIINSISLNKTYSAKGSSDPKMSTKYL